MKNTCLRIGDVVVIDTDTMEYGRVIGHADVLEDSCKDRKTVLVNSHSVKAYLIILKTDCTLKDEYETVRALKRARI